ncbi:MAG: threonylcarbamoyl-AMP synthase [Bacteroidales bacterium]|nr:threonylcarbamoyl-AMP synthase [Bacteroidales bacterium]
MVEEARKAGDHIKNGRIILYPTDTIWGIGCDATDPGAVQKIYRIKQRSDRKSMLVLMDGPIMLSRYLDIVPEAALDIISSAEKPTTIIYPGARRLAQNLLGEDGSVGIRITSDPFCQLLIQVTGKPIVSTSANVSGEPAASSFREITANIRDQVDYLVDWRQDEITASSPSTIIKLDKHGEITVIRP